MEKSLANVLRELLTVCDVQCSRLQDIVHFMKFRQVLLLHSKVHL